MRSTRCRTPMLASVTPSFVPPVHSSKPIAQVRQRMASVAAAIGDDIYEITAPAISIDDVVEVPTLRHRLTARESPFCKHNNFGGGFVSELDRVALSSIQFGSPDSTGASPGCHSNRAGDGAYHNTQDDDEECEVLPTWAVRAGARSTIYYEPEKVTAAIVTCGGLCPGLNDVIQSLVNKLTDYGVPEGKILGIKYGFRGFYDNRNSKPIVLTKSSVDGIHFQGGTILGTSRGGADMREIVKCIDLWGVDMLFVVGGNGGQAGADAIQKLCEIEGVCCAVVGVPKSIDNDILMIDKCFGFDTAVEESQRALMAAKVEASSAHNGIGLVKLMGRSSGFIAVQASLASGVVDVCLIPEVPFDLKGKNGLLAYVERVLKEKGHCVICVAEGAGQVLLDCTNEKDASGNPVLADIGRFLKNSLRQTLPLADIKFIDPTYMIRAIPTTSGDHIYCKILAHNAVHAAFAGFTGTTVGLMNTHYVYLPIAKVIRSVKMVDPKGKMWNRLRAAVGQPTFSNNETAIGTGTIDELHAYGYRSREK